MALFSCSSYGGHVGQPSGWPVSFCVRFANPACPPPYEVAAAPDKHKEASYDRLHHFS